MYRDFIRYIEKLAPETDDDDDDKIGFPVDRSELFRHIAAFTAYLVVNATPGSLVKEDEYRITIHDCQRSIISWMYWYWDAFHPSTPKPDRAELSRIMQIGLVRLKRRELFYRSIANYRYRCLPGIK